MSEKQIFENYKDKCPICGGDLDSNHQFCPYCGANLKSVNEQHRNNENIITDALDDIDEAKRKLAYRERQYKESKTQESGFLKKAIKWVLILAVVNFVLFLALGLILTAVEDVHDKKAEELRLALLKQEVDTDIYDGLDLDFYDFVNTKTQSSAGYVKEDKDVFAIPFYADSYSSDGVFKGIVYIENDGFEEFSSVTDSRASIYYEDCYLYIEVYDGYYEKTTDALYFYDGDALKNTKRLNNVKIGDAVFECYQMKDEFIMVHNPFGNCYLVIEGHPTWDNEYFSFDEMMKVLYVECDFEI